jgi:hypothetical protein
VAPPFFDDDLSFAQGVEDLPVQQFIAEPAIEALIVAVLPWGMSRSMLKFSE